MMWIISAPNRLLPDVVTARRSAAHERIRWRLLPSGPDL